MLAAFKLSYLCEAGLRGGAKAEREGMEETISDPTGFQAILTDECWRHITTHHPEMGPCRELVREAIRRPDGIYLGKRDPTRRIYRRRYRDVPVAGGQLDVLVFVDDARGYVATAYLAAYSIRMLGALIWPSK